TDGDFSRTLSIAPSSTTFAIPSDQPAVSTVEVADTQAANGRGTSARWDRQWSNVIATSVTFAASRFDDTLNRTGVATALSARNEINDDTFRAVASIVAGFNHAIEAGVEHAALDTAYN